MEYIWQNFLKEALGWIITVPAVIIVVGIIIEAIDKGISSLSRSEEIMFLVACLMLLLMVSGIF